MGFSTRKRVRSNVGWWLWWNGMIYEHHGDWCWWPSWNWTCRWGLTPWSGQKTILNQGTLILNLKKPKALEPQSSKARASGPKLGLKAREPSPARKNSKLDPENGRVEHSKRLGQLHWHPRDNTQQTSIPVTTYYKPRVRKTMRRSVSHLISICWAFLWMASLCMFKLCLGKLILDGEL